MSSKPILYNWDDSGSPGRNLTGNLQSRLKQILKACLVDGYGAKSSAGWSIGHEHPDGFSLTNNTGFISFVGYDSDLIECYISETIVDNGQALPDGLNLRSYKYVKGKSNSGAKHKLYLSELLLMDLSSLKWTLVANLNSVALSATISQGGMQKVLSFYFGNLLESDYDSFVAIGGGIDRVGNYSFAIGSALRNPLTGGIALPENIVYCPALKNERAYEDYAVSLQIPRNVPLMSPEVFMDGVGCVGNLAGIIYNDFVKSVSWNVSHRVIGFSGSSFTEGNNNPVLLENGYSIVYAHNALGPVYMTDDPEYWGSL